jgi:aspartyl aminopeptidase
MPLKAAKDKDKKNAISNNVLKILKDNYGIEEADFNSAELEIVPAGKARHAGFDKSMVLAYGHDDRVCSYSSLMGFLEAGTCKRTSCCMLVDKEEIGSVGATGMRSMFFENVTRELMEGLGKYSELGFRRCMMNSFMLSSDVSSGFDPLYASSFDKKNVSMLGYGFSIDKFTGSRGKSGSNDANAEYLGKLRKIFDDANCSYQLSELGKVDLGGGGTIAYMTALYGMNVIDCGVPVMNMHAPYEAISKADLYENKMGYIAFLKNA